MGKTAFIFPGQGSQYPGMGKDFYDSFETAKRVYRLAGEVTGLDLETLCFTENDRLNITEYTQIAMLTTEIAMLRVLEEKGVRADICAGLSLGEYGALAAGGVFTDAELFALIRKRGLYMQEAYPQGGAMTAVLGLTGDVVSRVCRETEGIVSVANYNCPGQIVITGEKLAVDRAAETLSAQGAKRCVPLKVSGPFHSALLKEAARKLEEALAGVEVQEIRIPYVCNVEAACVTDRNRVKELLAKQVVSSVRWQQSVEMMIAEGVDTFIEIGPGRTLTGFMRKINRDVRAVNVETVEDIEKALEAVNGQK